MIRDVDMEEFAAVVAEHDEDGQEAEGQGRHDEEVHGDDLPGMRGQKDAPGRRRPKGRSLHVLGDGQLGNLVPKQRELRPDPPPAPRGGFFAARVCKDELAELGGEPRAADRVSA